MAAAAAAALPLEPAVVAVLVAHQDAVVLVMAAAAPSACSLHFSSPGSASGSVGEAPPTARRKPRLEQGRRKWNG